MSDKNFEKKMKHFHKKRLRICYYSKWMCMICKKVIVVGDVYLGGKISGRIHHDCFIGWFS